jgi:hypothetical protein
VILDAIEKKYKVEKRDISIPKDLDKIITILGPRRSGKTSLIYSVISELQKTIPKEKLLYVNFEDDRLYPLKLEDMDTMIESYFDLFPDLRDDKVYFFFDEIQEVPNWEKFIRRVYDQFNCRVFITGSSSKFLSKEIATGLRGRTVPFEVFPLSFPEYLRFKGIKTGYLSSKTQSIIRNALQEYLLKGAYPELVDQQPEISRKILQEYLDLTIYRDITERHGIQNQSLLKYLVKYLFVNQANLLSVNKLYNDLKSQGFKVGRSTVYDYLSYLQDAYLIFQVEKFSKSVREQSVNPKKIYGIDTGMKAVVSIGEDWGRLYENIVFLHLRRKFNEIYYWKGKHEVDFYVDQKYLINVTYEIDSPKTEKRELDGLSEASSSLEFENALLITANREDEVIHDGVNIKLIPLWKWLLIFDKNDRF